MALQNLVNSLGIRAKFIFMLASLGAVALIGIGYGAYSFSMKNSLNEAATKAQIIDSYIKASREYFMTAQRPLINELVEKDRFYPEIMSGFGITRRTVDMVRGEELHGFKFRQVSMNPHHPPNKADLFEEGLIKNFQQDANLKTLFGKTRDKNGELFYYQSRPIKFASEGCLKCHLDPAYAPKDLIELYGDTNGFDKNYKLGDIFAAYVVYVPLAPAEAAARVQALILFAGGAGTMVVGLLFIWFFLDIRIVKPIMELSARTEEVSIGKNLEKSLASSQMKDEIAALAKSIDRLRISLVKMLKRRKNE
ncbi:MAG: DUF3365 domain-containing protein [Proteobacteria bacterium]|nr:DUF3365 domain-containing protein [Pseudomonadota bacterium]MBU1688315.1 DUF3365 domain-containing protein [Pseudomonadota bacterium]